MKIYHVAAMAQNRVIGKDNKLPWHFPEDLKFFKQLTTGSTVIMGRKTYASIGKPLPNRENFILSRKIGIATLPPEARNDGKVRFFSSLEEAVGNAKTEKVFIIGGAELYKETIAAIDGIYLTRIHKDYEGDAFYPEIPEIFREVEVQGLREADPRIDVAFYEKK